MSPTKDQVKSLVELSKLVPERIALELLSEAIEDYNISKSEETKKKLHRMLIVTSLKFSTEDRSVEEVVEGIDQVHKFKQMFNATN